MEYLLIAHTGFGVDQTMLREKEVTFNINGYLQGGPKPYSRVEKGVYYFDFYLKLYANATYLSPLIVFPMSYEQSRPFIENDQYLEFNNIKITLPDTFSNNDNDTDYYWMGIQGSNLGNTLSGRKGAWFAKPLIILRNYNTGSNISVSRPTTYGQNYTIPAIPNYRGYYTPDVWYNQDNNRELRPSDLLNIRQSLFSFHDKSLILYAKYEFLISYPITLLDNKGVTLSSNTYNLNENSYTTVEIDATSLTSGYQITGTPEASRGRNHPDGGLAVDINKHQSLNIYYLDIPTASYGDIDIDMKISPITYYILYMENITGHNNPITRTVLTSTITLTDPFPRNSHTFDGWYIDNTYINEIKEIPLGYVGNRILYAKWNLIEYDIVLDKDGGDITQADSTYNIEDDEIQIADGIPSKEGYKFDSFEIISGPDSGSPSINGAYLYINNSYGNIVIKVKWIPHDYNITYTGNDAGLSGLITSFNINDFPLTLERPIRPYYLVEFDNNTISTIGDKVINITQTPYNVTFIYNKNQAQAYTEVEGIMPDNIVDYRSGNFLFSLDENLYTAKGYTFAGWRIDNEGDVILDNTRKRLTQWNSDVINGNVEVELYAQWDMINYTISYTGNTTGLTFNKTSFDIEELDDEDYHIVLDTPTRTGYKVEFDEPVIETIGNKTIDVSQSLESYNITFDSQGGSDIDNKQYNIEQSVDLTNIIPVREGYTFNGWFTSVTGGYDVTSYSVGTNGNKALYAQWSINSYNIIFRNKYDSVDIILKNYSVEYNSIISAELFDGVIPSRPNIGNIIFTFIGWNTDSNKTTPLSDLGTVPVGGETFYAIYSYKIKGLRKGSSNVAFALGDTLLNNVALGDDIIWEKDDE